MISTVYMTLEEKWEYEKSRDREVRHARSGGMAVRKAVGRMNADAAHRKKMGKRSCLADAEKALQAKGLADRKVEDVLRRLPAGYERQRAVTLCLAQGMSRADVARILGVSRQRVGQMVAEHKEVPF